MTIEIRQLVIRAEVIPSDRPPSPTASGGRGGEVRPWHEELPAVDPPRQEPLQEELVEACVRQVLRRLERRRDR
ncbi:MAG: DUF5908 family protein [Cyanobium sp.]